MHKRYDTEAHATNSQAHATIAKKYMAQFSSTVVVTIELTMPLVNQHFYHLHGKNSFTETIYHATMPCGQHAMHVKHSTCRPWNDMRAQQQLFAGHNLCS